MVCFIYLEEEEGHGLVAKDLVRQCMTTPPLFSIES